MLVVVELEDIWLMCVFSGCFGWGLVIVYVCVVVVFGVFLLWLYLV